MWASEQGKLIMWYDEGSLDLKVSLPLYFLAFSACKTAYAVQAYVFSLRFPFIFCFILPQFRLLFMNNNWNRHVYEEVLQYIQSDVFCLQHACFVWLFLYF